jgi:hypothetical protein
VSAPGCVTLDEARAGGGLMVAGRLLHLVAFPATTRTTQEPEVGEVLSRRDSAEIHR